MDLKIHLYEIFLEGQNRLFHVDIEAKRIYRRWPGSD